MSFVQNSNPDNGSTHNPYTLRIIKAISPMPPLKFSLETQAKSRDLYRLLVADGRPEAKRTLTYGEAAKQIGMKHHRPLKFPLEIIQDACRDGNLPNITVLVVQKDQSLPADGCDDNTKTAFEATLDKVADYAWPEAPWW